MGMTALGLLTAGGAQAAEPAATLVKDVNTSPGYGYAGASHFVATGPTTTFFVAYDSTVDETALWKTDGTSAGTVKVKDIDAHQLTNVGGTLFFTASDADHGDELWKSDGTEAGTTRVKDIAPGDADSEPYDLVDVNGTLYFSAYSPDANHNRLFRSDGTEAGTVPIAGTSDPYDLLAVGSTVYFGEIGGDLNKYDGTTLTAIDTGGGSPSQLTNASGTVFFTENGSLFTYNGTTVAQVGDGGANVKVATGIAPVAIGGTLYFAGSTATHGNELYKSGGSTLARVAQVRTGAGDGLLGELTAVRTRLFFRGTDGSTGSELYSSDGTEAGTVRVADLRSGADSALSDSGGNLADVGGTLYFRAYDDDLGEELYTSDGSSVTLVKDLGPDDSDGIDSEAPLAIATAGATVVFAGNDGVVGSQLFQTNGTDAGTSLLKVIDVVPGSSVQDNDEQVAVGETTFFAAGDGLHGVELWKSDGTPAGTTELTDINPGVGSSYPADLTVVGTNVYFTAYEPTSKQSGLYRYDGTQVTLVKAIEAASLTAVGSTLFFNGYDDANGAELWKTDGTAGGTARVKDIVGGAGSSDPSGLTAVDGRLYFAASAGGNRTLWTSDGTEAGTVGIQGTGNPGSLTAVGSTLYFTQNGAGIGRELYKVTGTSAATLVGDLRSGPTGSEPQNLFNGNGTLYFTCNDGLHDFVLWKADANGATIVNDKTLMAGVVRPAMVGNTLYFGGNDGVHGWELWKSDGTSAGTTMVKDLVPGAGNGLQLDTGAYFANVDRTLYFSGRTAESDFQLYATDGTESGTRLVPGSPDLPSSLVTTPTRLSFFAYDDATAEEPWKLQVKAAPTPTAAATATATATATPGQTPVATPPITVVPTATPPAPAPAPAPGTAKRKPRLSKPKLAPARDRKAPFVFTLTGRLKLPAGVTGCGGRVKVVVREKHKTLFSGRAPVTKQCTYRIKTRLKHAGRHGTATFTTTYLGSAALKPTSSKSTAKYG